MLHLNVPPQFHKDAHGYFWVKSYMFLRKTMWMLFAVLAPEIFVGKALNELLSAMYNKKEMQNYAAQKSDWTLTHSFFANMGGFVLQFRIPEDQGSGTSSSHSRRPSHSTTTSRDLEIARIDSLVTARDAVISEEDNACSGDKALASEESGNLQSNTATVHPGAGDQRRPQRCRSSQKSLPRAQLLENPQKKSLSHGFAEHQPPDRPESDPVTIGIREELKQMARGDRRHHPGLTQLAGLNGEYIVGSTHWSLDNRNARRVKQAIDGYHSKSIASTGTGCPPFSAAHTKKVYGNISQMQGNLWILDASQLLFARECGIIRENPPISVEAINDKNKGDVVVKGLTLVQIVWLIMELAIRGAARLPVSQLEVVTLAFAITSILTYAMSWSKPQDAKFPILQIADRYPSSDELQNIAERGPTSFGRSRVDSWIPNNSIHVTGTEQYNYSFLLGCLLGATAFGVPHFLGWNLVFPTLAEQLLWRVSAIVTTAVPWALIIMDTLIYRLPGPSRIQGRVVVDAHWHGDSRPRRKIWYCTTYTLIVIYVLSRLFIILEAFRSLYWLPEATYKTTWSANIVHIS
jgi:hypothetical protein